MLLRSDGQDGRLRGKSTGGERVCDGCCLKRQTMYRDMRLRVNDEPYF